MNYPDQVSGDHLGIDFPTSVDALRVQGADFLTAAFQAAGAIGRDNSVSEITGCTEFFGGGMGRKLCLSVAYENPSPDLHTELFVKFPREFGDPLRSIFSPVMEPEVQFALLSRRPDFPVAVPKCYFADYHKETLSGLLITEKIAFGEGAIHPFYDKCLDYQLPEPLAHYQALIRSVAKLAGAHKAGALGLAIDEQFPHDPELIKETDLIPYTAEQLAEKLQKLKSFIGRYPQLFPAHIADSAFLDKFVAQAPLVRELDVPIKRYLNQQIDYVALSHWNGNLDNAWFWTNDRGELEAGLLDWGSVSQMNIGQSVFGILCAAEIPFLNTHKHDLIALFAEEYRKCSGIDIDVADLTFYNDLSTALLGIAWMLDAPSLIEAEIPDLARVRDRFDPMFRENFLARAQLQLLTVFLNEWQVEDLAAVCRRFSREQRPG